MISYTKLVEDNIRKERFKIKIIMRKILAILTLVSLSLVLTGCLRKVGETILNKEKSMALKNKKIAMIVAFSDYRDEEYEIPKKIFEENGAEVITVSFQLGEAKGKLGGSAKVDLSLGDLEVENFDAIVFVGGPGAAVYQDDAKAHRIVQEAVKENKILAAICIAPTILAKAGVLRGKKATVWSSFVDRESVETLEQEGASFVDEKVAQDGNIITANGPAAAEEFAKKILESLK